MSTISHHNRYTIAEYLERERAATEKHEYRDGEILLMAGGSGDHGLVVANVSGELRNVLKGKPCNVYDSNLRVGIPSTVLYTYPDATVICGPRETDPNDKTGETTTNPKVIIEVLSPSTEAYDRGEKFDRYRKLISLEEYVLVSVTTPRVEIYLRQNAGENQQWLFTWASGLEAFAKFRSLNVDIPLAEIYRGIEFPAISP